MRACDQSGGDRLTIIEWCLTALADESALSIVGGAFGVPRLFEADEEQQRTLSLVERHGLPVICLRIGSVVTRQLIEQLNGLVGDYHERRPAVALTSVDDGEAAPNAP